jgi:hypothetical protein
MSTLTIANLFGLCTRHIVQLNGAHACGQHEEIVAMGVLCACVCVCVLDSVHVHNTTHQMSRRMGCPSASVKAMDFFTTPCRLQISKRGPEMQKILSALSAHARCGFCVQCACVCVLARVHVHSTTVGVQCACCVCLLARVHVHNTTHRAAVENGIAAHVAALQLADLHL